MMDYQLSRHETRVVVSTGSVSTAAHHTRGGVGEGGGRSSEKYNRLNLPGFVQENYKLGQKLVI